MARKILITNDDGITAGGIVRLAKAAAQFGEVWVIAPESQRSAMSHSITLRHSIEVFPEDFPVEGIKAFACTGTPADCVRVGVRNIIPGKPDVVLSGINYGYNSATDVQYSATVGAAMEAAFQRIPAIAFSEGTGDKDEVADTYLPQLLEELLEKPLDYGEIWNVNFPTCELSEVKGILRDRTVSRHSIYDDCYDETPIEGGISYRVHGYYREEAEEGSDLRALFDNYISVGIVKNFC